MQWLALGNLFFLFIIPAILIIYLLKRKYEDQQISSILLWNKMIRDLEANRPWQKLQRNLLLLLQLLVAFLLIIALLRPAVPTNGTIAKHTLIVIDSSGSMLTWEGDSTRFQMAKNEAMDIIEHLGANQTITLIEIGTTPKILLTKSSNKNELTEALNDIKPRTGTGNDLAAFSLVKSIAAAESGTGIMWFSDGANSNLASIKEILPDGVRFEHIQVGKTRENISLTTFVTEQDTNYIKGLIRVDNFGTQAKDITLTVYDYNDKIIDSTGIKVNGNDSYSIELDNMPPSQAYKAIIKVDKDGLLEDNQVWSVPFSRGEVKTILVSEEGNHFLSQALKAGKLINLNKINKLPTEFDQTVDLWVFDKIVPEQLPQGNILLIGPDSKTEWLPYLGEKELEHNVGITKPNHQLLKHVKWDQVHIAKIKQLGNIPGLEPLIKSGEDSILLAGSIQDRRIIVLAIDLQQTDLALRTAFPIFIQNAVEWLSPNQTLPIANAYPGEKHTIPFTLGTKDKLITTPSGAIIPLNSSGSLITFEIPDEVGLFQLQETSENKQKSRFFSVQMNEVETEIKPAYIQINSEKNSTANSENNNEQNIHSGGFKELAIWFALIALIIAFIEWVVYRRGY